MRDALDLYEELGDIERTIAKPPGVRRAVFVGDSFVESRFTPLSLPAGVQQRLPAGDRIEAVNLGVAATDPRSYYYRIRDVALELQPDAVLLFLYAGNDFVNPDDGYSIWPRLVDESPGGALAGMVMPRTNWLLVNRLDLADFFRSRTKAPQSDETILFEAVTAPPAPRGHGDDRPAPSGSRSAPRPREPTPPPAPAVRSDTRLRPRGRDRRGRPPA